MEPSRLRAPHLQVTVLQCLCPEDAAPAESHGCQLLLLLLAGRLQHLQAPAEGVDLACGGDVCCRVL